MNKLKKALIAMLALVLFAGTFVIESVFSKSQIDTTNYQPILTVFSNQSVRLTRDQKTQYLKDKTEVLLMIGDVVETEAADAALLRFGDNGLIRPDAKTSLAFIAGGAGDEYIFSLLKGRVWFNQLFTNSTVNVLAGNTRITGRHDVFDARFDGEKTNVYAVKHALVLGLALPAEHTGGLSSHDAGATEFINSYLLPQGNQTAISASKVKEQSSILKKLLYSKLVKEFAVGIADPQTLKNDAWIRHNLEADDKLLEQVATSVLRNIRDGGIKIPSIHSFLYELSLALGRFANMLTFAPEKLNSRLINSIFDHLRDSEYLLVFGRLSESEEHLTFFKNLLSESLAGHGENFRVRLLKNLWREYQVLSFVGADEPLNAAKNAMSVILFTQAVTNEKFMLLRDTMDDAHDLADKNSQLAQRRLDEYFQEFNIILNNEKPDSAVLKNFLVGENQIMDNLLRLYPQFYRDRFFGMKNRLEQASLNLLAEGNDKNEQKQTIISNKIDFLRLLKNFFLADKITVDDARQIIFRLFKEAEDLRLPPEAAAAVNELYVKRLDDFGVFFRFLNSPEYTATPLHGATRQEQFKQYLAAQNERINVEQLQREVRASQAK